MRKYIIIVSILFLLSSSLCARIAIYGDTRTQDDVHARVTAKIASQTPIIAFHTGDLVNTGLNQAEYDKFHSITSPITSIAMFYPAKGNHEKNASLFLENFPELGAKTYYEVE
ncbi:MAG: metallophosphoesterase, partial [Candidatus Cloacimonadaceae bacterium]|nr:metallophosphoesterase [Candidatus Cloacimonadaceae bacterium]